MTPTDADDPQTAAPRFAGARAMFWGSILLFSALVGALAWEIVVESGLVAIRTRSGLGAEFAAYARAAGDKAILLSPAIFLASALWSASAILRRAAGGRPFGRAGAGSLADVGAALMWAGGMEVLGAPTLWAWSHDRMGGGPRLEFDLAALALMALGAALVFAGQALRDQAKGASLRSSASRTLGHSDSGTEK